MTLRVLALTPYPAAGAPSRYRVWQMAPALRKHGVEVTANPFYGDAAFARLHRRGAIAGKLLDQMRGTWARRRTLRSAGGFDVALVHRELSPLADPRLVDLLERHQPRWVFDFDDAVHLANVSDANRWAGGLKSHSVAPLLARRATRISAGNRWLGEWALGERSGRPPGDVHVVPTAVDAEAWQPRPRSERTRRVAWIGSPTTASYLELARPALERLSARWPDFELHVVGARVELPGVRCVSHAWSAASEIERVAACDVGLAPLPMSDWANGKCGLKLLLYMALGLPSVASAAGVHLDILRHGDNGMLAANPGEFEHFLAALLDDPALAARVGAAGRATVLEGYSIDAVAPKLARTLTEAAEAA